VLWITVLCAVASGRVAAQEEQAPARIGPIHLSISVELPDDWPGALLTVNGSRLPVALDTGSGMSVALLDSAARILELELRQTEHGRFHWSTVTLGTDAEGTPSEPVDVRVFAAPPGSPIDAIIGWPLLQEQIWWLNYPNRTQGVFSSVPQLAKEEWQSFPIVDHTGGILAIEIPNGDDQIVLEIDTGSLGGLSIPQGLWETWLEEHPDHWSTLEAIYSPSFQSGFAAVPTTLVEDYRLGDLAIGPIELAMQMQQVTIEGRPSEDANPTIGIGVLQYRTIIIDGPGRRVYFGPLTERDEEESVNINRAQATFLPERLDGGPMTAHVIEDGVAYQAGLRDGDTLLRVNGRDALDWPNDEQVRPGGFCTAAPGTAVHLVIDREGEQIDISFELGASPFDR